MIDRINYRRISKEYLEAYLVWSGHRDLILIKEGYQRKCYMESFIRNEFSEMVYKLGFIYKVDELTDNEVLIILTKDDKKAKTMLYSKISRDNVRKKKSVQAQEELVTIQDFIDKYGF